MEIKNDRLVFAMDKENKPVAKAKSGDKIIFHTLDCFCENLQNEEQKIAELDFDKVNPATGPLFVEGAEIGDVLKVKIEKINIKNTGMALAAPGMGVLGEKIEKEKIRKIHIENDNINFLGRKLPLRKMIGVIGTAPDKGDILILQIVQAPLNIKFKEIRLNNIKGRLPTHCPLMKGNHYGLYYLTNKCKHANIKNIGISCFLNCNIRCILEGFNSPLF